MSRPLRLNHVTSRGKVRDWRGHKLKALATATAYRSADAKAHARRAERIAECANRLEFVRDDKLLRLRRTFSCKNRLCPVCQAIAAQRDFAILATRVATHAQLHPRAMPVLLTLTVPNVPGDALHGAVTHILASYRKLVRMMAVTRAVMGWHRTLEITFNPTRHDFHPHIHALMFVRDGYFRAESPLYLTQAAWVALWAKAAGIAAPIVDVRRVGHDRVGVLDIRSDALFEVTKYAVSPVDYYAETADGWRVDPAVLAPLHAAIKGRRLRDVGGSMRAIKKTALPKRPTDAELEAAHAEFETYEFSDWMDEHGELHGFDYWARAPPQSDASD